MKLFRLKNTVICTLRAVFSIQEISLQYVVIKLNASEITLIKREVHFMRVAFHYQRLLFTSLFWLVPILLLWDHCQLSCNESTIAPVCNPSLEKKALEEGCSKRVRLIISWTNCLVGMDIVCIHIWIYLIKVVILMNDVGIVFNQLRR